jgi:hypothetical protein
MAIIVSSTNAAATFRVAVLPWTKDFVIKRIRPSSEEMSLAGTMIRQSADKDISTGTIQYSEMVITADADRLKLIDDNESTCFLSDGEHVYEAEIDATVYPNEKGGRKKVEATFRIVREVI